MREVVVVGAGLHRYGVFPDKSAIALGTVAIQRALDDAGCQWSDMDAVYCGTVRLGMSAGHTICRHMGTTGLAITNVPWQPMFWCTERIKAAGSGSLSPHVCVPLAIPSIRRILLPPWKPPWNSGTSGSRRGRPQ